MTNQPETVADTVTPVAETQAAGAGEAGVFTKADVDRAISKAFEKWQREKDIAIDEERRKAEESRMREQGQFQKLFEQSDAELKRLKDELRAKEFQAQASTTLGEIGVPEFAPILLSNRSTVREIEESGKQLSELIEKRVEAEVAKRLDTGKRPTQTQPPNTKRPDEMTTDEWKAARAAWNIH